MSYTRAYIDEVAAHEGSVSYGIYHDILNQLIAENDALMVDAERYQCIRSKHWSDSDFCVASKPAENVRLGSFCPSHELLDNLVDEARKKGGE